ncbi:hypothetical protein QW180_23265 [Vibrio sinaloensis]|nr:hypothetical protein [Vibrio sinaloensis]
MNDHSYLNDEFKREDARWVNRPQISPQAVALAETKGSYQHRINQDLKQMIALRRNHPEFGNAKTEILETYRSQLFLLTAALTQRVSNFSLSVISLNPRNQFRRRYAIFLGSRRPRDLLSGNQLVGEDILLAAYDVLWLKVTE